MSDDRFSQYQAAYASNWANLVIRPSREAEVERQVHKLLDGKVRYQQIEAASGVPWWFIGLCHYRESDFDFDTYLGNGQSLHRVTTEVPEGRGPFNGPNAFLDGAVDALKVQGFMGAKDWSAERTSYRFEGFNGYGYHNFGVNAPYLYGGSTLYGPPEAKNGKYVADHQFRWVTDTQLGVLVILKKAMELDPTIRFSASTTAEPDPDHHIEHGVAWVQHSLNILIPGVNLVEDGKFGPHTANALEIFQRSAGVPVTRQPDAATVAAMERMLTAQPKPAAPTTQPPAPTPSAPAPDQPSQPEPAASPTLMSQAGKALLKVLFG